MLHIKPLMTPATPERNLSHSSACHGQADITPSIFSDNLVIEVFIINSNFSVVISKSSIEDLNISIGFLKLSTDLLRDDITSSKSLV